MPDLFQYGAGLLVRDEPISYDEWVTLLESRAKLIKAHLDCFLLTAIGDVECLRAERHYHKIRDNNPSVMADFGLGIDTRGLFSTGETEHVRKDMGISAWAGEGPIVGGVHTLWGIDRKADWIVAKVRYMNEPGYKGRGYERATTLLVSRVDVHVLIAAVGRMNEVEAAEYAWLMLGQGVHNWVTHRSQLWNQAVELERQVLAQESAVRALNFKLDD